jgi:hypothetical protein
MLFRLPTPRRKLRYRIGDRLFSRAFYKDPKWFLDSPPWFKAVARWFGVVIIDKIHTPDFSRVTASRFEQDKDGTWWHVETRTPYNLDNLRKYDLHSVILENMMRDLAVPFMGEPIKRETTATVAREMQRAAEIYYGTRLAQGR